MGEFSYVPDCWSILIVLFVILLCWFFLVQKPFGIEMEFGQLRVSTVKTTDTIESLTQQELLYKNLENYAGNQRGESGMSMLDNVAAEAAALAEMQTQVVDSPTIVASMEVETVPMAGHIAKRSALAMGADGGPAGCPKVVDIAKTWKVKMRIQVVLRTIIWVERIGHSWQPHVS